MGGVTQSGAVDSGESITSHCRIPPPGTVRGAVSGWLLANRHLLKPLVLEAGACNPHQAWWRDLRAQLGFQPFEWYGIDIQPGPQVDEVVDLCDPVGIGDLSSLAAFGGVVCAEVLEHVASPRRAVANLLRVMSPGAWMLVTMPFGFPIHGFPDDYWRFTPSGLAHVLRDAGFVQVHTEAGPTYPLTLCDHDLGRPEHREVPMHVFGRAQCP